MLYAREWPLNKITKKKRKKTHTKKTKKTAVHFMIKECCGMWPICYGKYCDSMVTLWWQYDDISGIVQLSGWGKVQGSGYARHREVCKWWRKRQRWGDQTEDRPCLYESQAWRVKGQPAVSGKGTLGPSLSTDVVRPRALGALACLGMTFRYGLGGRLPHGKTKK